MPTTTPPTSDVAARLQALLDEARRRVEDRARSELELAFAPVRPAVRAAAAPAGRSALRPSPPVPAARPLLLRLPNGRKVRVTPDPAVARRDDLERMGRVAAANDRAAFAALARHERAIRRLTRSRDELAEKVAVLQEQADLALVSFLDRLSGLARRVESVRTVSGHAVAAERASSKALLARQRALRSELRARTAEARIQKLTAAANTLEGAAFGRKGNLFARDNLLLAGNQLLWSFVDPILRGLGLWAERGPSPIASLAPIGSLLTAHAALGGKSAGKGQGGAIP